MLQNMSGEAINTKNRAAEKLGKLGKLNIFSNVFSKQYILLYIISFLLSLVSINGEFSIFSISILGACIATSVPALGVVALSLVGNIIKFGVGGALGYILTSLVLIATLFLIKPVYNEGERNEKIKIGKNIFIATFIIQIVKLAMSTFTIYDMLTSITISIIALVFYKIFVNSLVVVQNITARRAFSIEELIGASLLLAIAVTAFGELNVWGIEIKNVLSILIVMVLGWKNGILVGTTSGVTIGVTLGVITSSEPIMIAAYAISGLLAGIFGRFGKVGVVVGFALGNVLLAYISNGYTVELIHFKEILIAFIALLAVPSNFKIDLEEFVGTEKFLPPIPDRALNKSKAMAENLSNVSEAIQDMAKPLASKENEEENNNKQIFITELLNSLEPYKDNMLYEDVAKPDGKIVDEIFKYLIDKQEITRDALLSIFAKCNSFIISTGDNKISDRLDEDITQMIRIINISYKVSKNDFIWRKKVAENKKTMNKQLSEVSKAIQKMAKDIEEDTKNEAKYNKQKTEIIKLIKAKEIEIEDIGIKKDGRFMVEIYLNEILETAKIEAIEKILTQVLGEPIVLNDEASVGKKLDFISDDKYEMALGTSETTKNGSELSGDSMLNIRLKDGKYLVAISDGMGTGKSAKNSSSRALRMLENLLLSGFDKEISLDLINTSLMSQESEMFATLDIAIIDLYAGNIEFIKSAACPTYIKNKKSVQIIKANSLPTGIVENSNLQSFDRDIASGDIMLMCTDGVLDANIEYKNKELWLKYLLEDIETVNTKKIANLVLNEAIDNNFGKIKDDMTVIVCKFNKK